MTSISRNAGGLAPVGRRLAQELIRLPATAVSVVGLRDEYSNEDLALWSPVGVRLCQGHGPKRLGWSANYASALRSEAPDIVHQHGIWSLLALEATRFRREHGKLVISLHGMIEPWALQNARAKKRLAWLAYQRRNLASADCLMVSSEPEVRYVRELGIKTPIAVVPNGADALPLGTNSSELGSLPDERRVVLFLGRLHPKKGLAELLGGWAELLRGQPELRAQWTLMITGWDDGGYEATLRGLAKELGFGPSELVFTGPLFGEQRDAALARASAFILPSFGEGMPMAALEALASGVPVLLTEACNLNVVFDAGAGIRIEATEAGVCRGLAQFVALSTVERGEMAARARRLAAERFAWPQLAAEVRAVYAWLLGQGSRPSQVF